MELILVGGGGHARSCIACIEPLGLTIRGVLDVREKIGQRIGGYEIVGCDEDIGRFAAEGLEFLVTLGQIETAAARARLFDAVTAAGGRPATIVARNASVARTAALGAGTIVMQGAVVNAEAAIGRNCIVNTGAVVEHDAVVGDHVHVSTGAIVNGSCSIGDGCFIGSGSVLRHGIVICPGAVIGHGSVVAKSVLEPGIYFGNPLRRKS